MFIIIQQGQSAKKNADSKYKYPTSTPSIEKAIQCELAFSFILNKGLNCNLPNTNTHQLVSSADEGTISYLSACLQNT